MKSLFRKWLKRRILFLILKRTVPDKEFGCLSSIEQAEIYYEYLTEKITVSTDIILRGDSQ